MAESRILLMSTIKPHVAKIGDVCDADIEAESANTYLPHISVVSPLTSATVLWPPYSEIDLYTVLPRITYELSVIDL